MSNTATNLFEPFRMGNILLANRFVMNPMTRCRADATDTPRDLMAEYYGQRATAGLIDSLGMQDYPAPQEMTEADILQAKAEFVQAAKNAIAAGFDGVELHGANGYLLEQFLSPTTNLRTGAWRGSVENRIKFVVEVVRETAVTIGGDKLGIRLSPYGTNSGMVA